MSYNQYPPNRTSPPPRSIQIACSSISEYSDNSALQNPPTPTTALPRDIHLHHIPNNQVLDTGLLQDHISNLRPDPIPLTPRRRSDTLLQVPRAPDTTKHLRLNLCILPMVVHNKLSIHLMEGRAIRRVPRLLGHTVVPLRRTPRKTSKAVRPHLLPRAATSQARWPQAISDAKPMPCGKR